MAYMRPCISEEIRTAIQLDYLRTVPEAINAIKKYLEMAVMPLTLRQLEVVRYRPPQGQTQTLTTQTVIQMFREAQFWDVVPEQILKVILLNNIQTKDVITMVQERLRETDDWEVVKKPHNHD